MAARHSPTDDELRAAVASELLQHPNVLECSVAVRGAGAVPRVVAHVVADERASTDDLVQALEAAPRLAGVSIGVVRVPGLPFRDDGGVDAVALEALSLVDSYRVRQLEDEVAGAGCAGARLTLVTLPAMNRRDPREPSSEIYGGQRPSLVERAPADSTGFPATLPAALRRAAQRSPDRGHTIVGPDGRVAFLGYADLLRRAETGCGLLSRTVGIGAPVVLQLPDHEQLFAAYWTVVLGGAVPVIAPVPDSYRREGPVLERLRALVESLGAPAVLTSRAYRYDLEAALPGGARVLALEELAGGDDTRAEPAPTDPAILQLTSGSTGVPKCILLTHENVMTAVLGNITELHNSPDDVILTWAPMDHIGSLIHSIRAVCLGCDAVVARPEYIVADPLRWLDLMSTHRATNTWAPSFAYKLVLERLRASAGQPRRWDLGRVRVLINAGEQVAVDVARELCQALEPCGLDPRAMKPAFGMGELGSGVTHSHAFDPVHGRGTYRLDRAALTAGRAARARPDDDNPLTLCGLGGPIPGAAVRVVDADNALVPEGTIGRVQFAGKNVMRGYYRNDAANAAVFQPDGWFDSGDLGFLHSGDLVITGREKEIVIVRGNNLLCHDVEAAATVRGVLPTWVAAVGVAVSGAEEECLAIFYVASPDPSEPLEIAASIRESTARRIGVVPDYVVPVAQEDFPRTTSGKIQRRQLGRWFEEGRFVDLAVNALHAPPRSVVLTSEWLPDLLDRPALPAGRRFLLVGGVVSQLERIAAELRDRGHSVRCELLTDDTAEEAMSFLTASAPHELVALIGAAAGGSGAQAGDLLQVQAALARPLLAVLRTLAGSPTKPERVTVVTRRCFPAEPDAECAAECAAECDRSQAILPGLLRSAARELGIRVRQLDLSRDDLPTARIATELAVQDGHDAVCLGSGGRLLRRLSAGTPASVGSNDQPSWLAPGAGCVVVGGLGGVGFVLGRWLLTHDHRARLLAIGRTPLHRLDELAAERLRSLQQLGDVEYAAADVADLGALEATVGRVERRWGADADWLFQLAASVHPRALGDTSWDDLAAQLRPKVAGAVALGHLLDARPGATLVLFSSVIGAFGAAMHAGYAAACGFEQLFASAAGVAAPPRVRCLSWSMWDGIGMSGDRSLRDVAIRRGYLPLRADSALAVLDAALGAGATNLLVGVDVGSESLGVVARWGAFSQYLKVEGTDQTGAQLIRARAREQLGLTVEVLEPAAEATASVGADSSPAEVQIAGLWCEVLGIVRVPLDRSFFALGASSLNAMILVGLLNQKFDLNLQVDVLTANPTVQSLARYVERERERR